MADPPYQLDDKDKGKNKRRTYSEDEVQDLVSSRSREAAREAALEALRERDKERETKSGGGGNGDENEFLGIDPKVVKQLQTTVSVFNALKEFASNPIQKAIETEVGTLSADVVRQAFKRPSAEGGKKDLLDVFLNSQFAYGLGHGLGERGPELVETMDKTFGKKKTEQYFDNIMGLGGGLGGSKQISRGNPGSATGGAQRSRAAQADERSEVSTGDGARTKRDAERELILSLDPNNAEHVAAYADSQGGMSVIVAQKMLRIQQDDFIHQLELENTAIKKELNKNIEDGTAVSFKDIQKKEKVKETKAKKKETVETVETVETMETMEDVAGDEVAEGGIVEIPDRWEGDEGLVTKERREYEKKVMLEKEKAQKPVSELASGLAGPTKSANVHDSSAELVKTEMENRKKLNEQASPVPINQVVEENAPENPNIELVIQENIKENPENITEKENIKLCPKCKKIKPLIETEKGPMCQECRSKRGL